MSRGQEFADTVRLFKSLGGGWEAMDMDQEAEAGADLSDFTDGSRVSAFALEALSWANGQELMQGYGDGYIGPKDTVTRAQMAKLLTVLAERF